jgi:glutamate 5-kinase
MSSISDKKRIVIKLGTSTLTHKTGRLNLRRMNNLVRVIADLHNSGKEIIMVSSGAIGLGVGKLGLKERPTDTPSKQACASVGQCELMYMYDNLFDEYGITVSQILLTKTIIETERQKNVENTFKRLLDFGVIPIVNENDTVAIDELELEIGENDSLSAIVAKLCGADLLVILSDIDGLYSSDPHKSDNARLIPVVAEISSYIENIAGGAGSALGTGGMTTKINAGKIATENGIDMVIMNGDNPEKLYDLFEDKPIGTLFLAKNEMDCNLSKCDSI